MAELEEQRKQWEAARQQEQAEMKQRVKEENALWRAERAQARKAEQGARIITRTVRGPKSTVLKRAVEMAATLTER